MVFIQITTYSYPVSDIDDIMNMEPCHRTVKHSCRLNGTALLLPKCMNTTTTTMKYF